MINPNNYNLIVVGRALPKVDDIWIYQQEARL